MKNIKKLFSDAPSISVQLTFFYSLSTFILIFIVSLFFYLGMVNILHNADYQFLSDEINIIKNILATKPNNLIALKQEITDIPSSLNSSVYHYYIRVLDHNKTVISETQHMDKILKHNSFFAAETASLAKQDQCQWWQTDDDNHYLLMWSSVNVGKESHLWTIQIALDVSYQKAVINTYRKYGIIVLFAGALFSILIGYLISRRGMRRLYELTSITKKITANALQQRIDPQFWPKELNELAAAYNQMLDRIEESVSRLTVFSDDLAHELRIPITNLMGETEVALFQDYSIEDYKRVMESNLEELNRLYQIIENLLFLARAENPQFDISKIELNLANEINVMCRYYQAVADEKYIQLSHEGEAIASVNSVMFRRMIGNILSNALKYSIHGGNVIFTIKEMDNQAVQIILTDTGVGIAKKDLPNIFNRFYRADTARTQSTCGTGLGLAIVKSIVALHHGTILVSSVIGNGTEIIINLPK